MHAQLYSCGHRCLVACLLFLLLPPNQVAFAVSWLHFWLLVVLLWLLDGKCVTARG